MDKETISPKSVLIASFMTAGCLVWVENQLHYLKDTYPVSAILPIFKLLCFPKKTQLNWTPADFEGRDPLDDENSSPSQSIHNNMGNQISNQCD